MDNIQTHTQPYPLWASWTEAPGEDFTGRVVGWASVVERSEDGDMEDVIYWPVVDSRSNVGGLQYRTVQVVVTLHDQDPELEHTPGVAMPPAPITEGTPRDNPGVDRPACWCTNQFSAPHPHAPSGHGKRNCPSTPTLRP